MSDHLSPEQQDPEQRIRELEQGLADTNRPASRYPARFPDDSGASTPTWTSSPVPSGHRGAPAFRPRSAGLRWIGIVVGFVFPLAIAVAFVVPWQHLSVFDGLLGPTKVPNGGSLTVNESNKTKTIECNDGRLTLNGNNLTVTVTGHCANLFVNGYNHQVTVDSADGIQVNGVNSIVVYHSGRPAISKNGSVTVTQG